jgi:cyclopentanol dehydrogenase
MGRLTGKVALVTGAARGIGAGCATVMAREGAQVVITDILDDEGRSRARLINELGGAAAYVHLDATKPADWDRAVEFAVQTFGKLNVLVNNAGGGGGANMVTIEEGTKADWEKVQDVNATSTFLGTRAVVPAMRQAGGGCIINISSIYGIVGSQSATAYHAAKGAVRLFTKATALQLAPHNIRVCSIHPGHIKSHMFLSNRTRDDRARDELLTKYPVGRFGEPEDIGYGAVFLASDASSFITGTELVIDGGYTAQ